MNDTLDDGFFPVKPAPIWDGPIEPFVGILSLMTDLVVMTDCDGAITWINTSFERKSGYLLAEAVGRHITKITMSAINCDVEQAFAARSTCAGEMVYTTKSGTHYTVSFEMRPLLGDNGGAYGFLFMHRDVTRQRDLESSLRSERYFLTRMIDTGVSAVAAFDEVGRCVFANSEARDVLDKLTRAERLCAASWPLKRVVAEPETDNVADPHPQELPFSRVMRTGKPVHGMVVELLLPDLPRRVFSVNAAPLRDSETSARVVMALTDISARFEAEALRRSAAAQARFDARHDALTGLPNGRYFASTLAEAVEPATVLLIDIDNFRSIRTVLGRRVGDALLCAFGSRLEQVLAGRGFLARSEGNAFTILQNATGSEAVEALAQEILSALQLPFNLEEITVFATASIGLSHRVTETYTQTYGGLLRQAEIANFAAKADVSSRLAYYNTEMDAQLSRRNVVVQALRHALQADQFELAFQPKFAVPSGPIGDDFVGQLVGAEALLRWNAPDLGRVGPDEFIPIAEAVGVISDIDFHVMGVFARQLGAWQSKGYCVPASINLSPRSFEDSTLAPRLLQLLKSQGVAASSVTVEITETSLVSMSKAALANIDQLRQAGIHLSIDDFGTGYSSFSYLQKLIVSEIKIDKSFIHLLSSANQAQSDASHHGTRTIVRSILALARTLGIRAVAEGVENLEQLAWLQQEGCHVVQGFLCGHAVSAEMFECSYLRAKG